MTERKVWCVACDVEAVRSFIGWKCPKCDEIATRTQVIKAEKDYQARSCVTLAAERYLSDILRGGYIGEPETLVDRAWRLAELMEERKK